MESERESGHRNARRSSGATLIVGIASATPSRAAISRFAPPTARRAPGRVTDSSGPVLNPNQEQIRSKSGVRSQESSLVASPAFTPDSSYRRIAYCGNDGWRKLNGRPKPPIPALPWRQNLPALASMLHIYCGGPYSITRCGRSRRSSAASFDEIVTSLGTLSALRACECSCPFYGAVRKAWRPMAAFGDDLEGRAFVLVLVLVLEWRRGDDGTKRREADGCGMSDDERQARRCDGRGSRRARPRGPTPVPTVQVERCRKAPVGWRYRRSADQEAFQEEGRRSLASRPTSGVASRPSRCTRHASR